MKYLAKVSFLSFRRPDQPVKHVEDVPVEAATDEEACGELFRAFNHAIPGETGELAEKHETRSMSVGDVVELFVIGSHARRAFTCEMAGWKRAPRGCEAIVGELIMNTHTGQVGRVYAVEKTSKIKAWERGESVVRDVGRETPIVKVGRTSLAYSALVDAHFEREDHVDYGRPIRRTRA